MADTYKPHRQLDLNEDGSQVDRQATTRLKRANTQTETKFATGRPLIGRGCTHVTLATVSALAISGQARTIDDIANIIQSVTRGCLGHHGASAQCAGLF